MNQLLLHFLGDYILQNSWMALNKKNKGFNGFIACLTHCAVYAAPFKLIASWPAVAVIFATHFVIDRTKLVDWFIATRERTHSIANFGFPAERPVFLTLWLYIIIDNLFHVSCNYAAIKFL